MTKEEAIKHLKDIRRDMWTEESEVDAINMAIKALEQPERKKGEWIDHSDDGYVECPFCRSATNCDDDINELHYCFSCGADMRGKQDD